MNKKNELRKRGIFNDAELCQIAGQIITANLSPKVSRNGGTFWSGVVLGKANGHAWTVTSTLHGYGGKEQKQQAYDRMKQAAGGEWERSPFSPDSWFPKGTLEKALALPQTNLVQGKVDPTDPLAPYMQERVSPEQLQYMIDESQGKL